MKEGLRKLTKDERDFRVGAIFNLPKLSELPKEFTVGKTKIKDQGQTDMCSAFASCSVSEQQEGVELCPEWLFAVAKDLEGSGDLFGLELRSACKAHVKKGCIEQKDAPFSLKDKDYSFLKDITNWPAELLDKALYHKKDSYFAISGPYDTFDNIRASLFKFKTRALIGLIWPNGLSVRDRVYGTPADNGFGHAMAVIGYETKNGVLYLKVQNSYSEDAHDDGIILISREVINRFTGDYGAFMFIDLSKEKAEYYRDKGIKASENPVLMQMWWLEKMVILLKQVIKELTAKKKV